MSFFTNLESFGQLEARQRAVSSRNPDLTLRARENFITQVKKQLKAIYEPPKKSDWVRQEPGGKVSICLRNGTGTIPLPGGKTHIVVPTTVDAVRFLEQAIEACNAGEFDQVLAETKSVVVRKKKEVK